MYIAAHPDDENTRLISYLTQEKGYRVGYLSLTRGDGGQNLIGNEQGEKLGIIRSQELLAARKIDGAIQFFTRAYDFGYSKTPEETFEKWNREKILEDVVFVIRYFKPDVIICRFPTTGEGGHGHHTASAMLAVEAFEISGDINKFPEQKNIGAWKAHRLVWNTFNFGSTNTTSENQLKIDVGGFNTFIGKSYGEIAAEARSQHRSQAFGSERRRGEQFEYFKHLAGIKAEKNLLEGIKTDFTRFEKSKKIIKLITKIEKNFSALAPYKSIPDLLLAKKELNFLVSQEGSSYHWYLQKSREINSLIQKCSGLYFELISPQAFYCNNDTLHLRLQMINRSPVEIKLTELITPFVEINSQVHGITLTANSWKSIELKFLAKDLSLTSPYKHRHHTIQEKSVNTSMLYQCFTEQRPEISCFIQFSFGTGPIDFPMQVQYKFVDPSFGEIYQPLTIAPPASVNFKEEHYIFNQSGIRPIHLIVKGFKPNITVKVRLENSFGFKTDSLEKTIHFTTIGEEKEINFLLSYNQQIAARDRYLKAVISYNNQEYSYSYHQIHYDHIPEQIWFDESKVSFSLVNLEMNTKKIAYLTGAGDKIPEVLQQLGYEITVINESDLATKNLQEFEAVITGVRAFNTLKNLKYLNKKLLAYVNQGGNLIVQYNTNGNLITNEIGPYPFKISRDRVTEEDCDVRILKKDHPLLLYPNSITSEDFKDWIQERGLYFPSDINENYDKFFSMNDKNGSPLDNSLIFCNYGKGKFYYTGISFFRQLPAGVPGAIKLFVNILSKNEKNNISLTK